GYLAKVVAADQRMRQYSLWLTTVPPFLTALNTVAILAVGALRVMDGQLTIGMLVAIQSLVASFLEPVNQLVALGGTLQEAEAEMHRLDDVLRYEAGVAGAGSSKPRGFEGSAPAPPARPFVLGPLSSAL